MSNAGLKEGLETLTEVVGGGCHCSGNCLVRDRLSTASHLLRFRPRTARSQGRRHRAPQPSRGFLDRNGAAARFRFLVATKT